MAKEQPSWLPGETAATPGHRRIQVPGSDHLERGELLHQCQTPADPALVAPQLGLVLGQVIIANKAHDPRFFEHVDAVTQAVQAVDGPFAV